MVRTVSVGPFWLHCIPFVVTPIDCRTYAIGTQSTAANSPVHPSQIKIFEQNNPLIAIHCLALSDKKDSYSILYLSPYMHRRPHKISLLLLDDPAGGDHKHYVWIKSLSCFITSNYAHAHARDVCMSCLESFTTSRVLHEHERYCLMHEPQQCIYPSGDEAKLAFTRWQYQFLYDFYLVADFECFLVPSDDERTRSFRILCLSGDATRTLLDATSCIRRQWRWRRHGRFFSLRIRLV